jgi:hypothetical protein
MGSEGYNNALTRTMFRRVNNEAAFAARMYRTIERTLRPQDMVPPLTLLRWLLAESLAGNFAPWSALARTMRFGVRVARQQAILDRALAKAERGDRDNRVPSLAA